MLDTSVAIDASRRGLGVNGMLAGISGNPGDEVAISAMTLMEFAHGVVRMRNEAGRMRQQKFLNDLRAAVAVIAATEEIAIRAGRLDAELLSNGVTIGTADAVIAATALELRYGVATLNGKHFRVVPGLDVVEL